jgi:NRPS condensation-like uncharacterized protein
VIESVDRPLGSTENIYWLLDRLYCLNFVVYAQLDCALPRRPLAAALAIVQDEHPLLRARIAVDGGRAWFKPVARRDAPILPQHRPLAGWRRALERELQRPFAPGAAPLARFLCFGGTGAKRVAAMVFHHAIADGRSGTTVLLDVLRRATHPPAPPDYRRAQPSSQSLDLIRAKSPMLSALQEARFWWAKGKDALRLARQLPDYDATPSGAPDIRIIAFSLPRATTASLAATARLRGTTVQGALGAAQLLALNDEFTARAPRPLALNSLADLRGVLAGNLTERDLGLYVTTLCTVHALPANPDFWSLAREVRDALAATIDSGDANLINGVYPANPRLEPGEDVARLMQRIVALAPPSSMLTNIGRVDVVDLGDRCRIRELAFAVSPPAQHPICVTAASYDGALSLGLLYDRHKLPAARAKAIGERLVARLEAAAS